MKYNEEDITAVKKIYLEEQSSVQNRTSTKEIKVEIALNVEGQAETISNGKTKSEKSVPPLEQIPAVDAECATENNQDLGYDEYYKPLSVIVVREEEDVFIEEFTELETHFASFKEQADAFAKRHASSINQAKFNEMSKLLSELKSWFSPIRESNQKKQREKENQRVMDDCRKEFSEWKSNFDLLLARVSEEIGKLGSPMSGEVFEKSIEMPLLDAIGCRYEACKSSCGLEVSVEGTKLSIKGIPNVSNPIKEPIVNISMNSSIDGLIFPKWTAIRDDKDRQNLNQEIASLYNQAISDSKNLINVLVRPDPRKMWKRIPAANDMKFYKPDVDFGSCRVPDGWRAVAGSQKGRSHWHVGSARDDDFALVSNESSGWIMLAAADGAGSKKYSREGARFVCEYLKNHLLSEIKTDNEEIFSRFTTDPDNPDLKQMVRNEAYKLLVGTAYRALGKLKEKTKVEAVPLSDFSTTILIALLKKYKEGWLIATFSIGDGAIGLYDGPNGNKLLSRPDEGEYSGQTRFITSDEVWTNTEELNSRIYVTFVKNFDALLVMTDGVSDPMFETVKQLENTDSWKRFYKELCEEVIDGRSPEDVPSRLTEYLDFYSPGNHDDRTLVMMYRERDAK